MYYLNPREIENSINWLIGNLEQNLKEYAERLAQREMRDGLPHHLYQTEIYKLKSSIKSLKSVRDTLGCLQWIPCPCPNCGSDFDDVTGCSECTLSPQDFE